MWCWPRTASTFVDWRNRLHNKALLVGRTLMGLEIWREMRAVDLLETLPEVDSERIGFYGLSQGGKMALWFPPLEPRIRATIISAFYNERTKKQLVGLSPLPALHQYSGAVLLRTGLSDRVL